MNLRFDYNAIEKLFTEHGIDLVQFAASGRTPNPVDLKALVWAGSLHINKDLTLEDAAEIMQGENYLTLIESTVKAAAEALKPADDDGDEKQA